MKNLYSLLTLILLGFCSSATAVTVSNFGTDVSAGDLVGSWAGNYDSGTSTLLAGATDAAGSGIQDFTGPAIGDLTGSLFLSLTASSSAAPNSGFNVLLYDAQGDTVLSSFNWTSFDGGATVQSALSSNAAFDPTNVIGWQIATGGVGGSLSGVSFTSLEAIGVVPEPSAFALIAGCFGLAWVMVRRRA